MLDEGIPPAHTFSYLASTLILDGLLPGSERESKPAYLIDVRHMLAPVPMESRAVPPFQQKGTESNLIPRCGDLSRCRLR